MFVAGRTEKAGIRAALLPLVILLDVSHADSFEGLCGTKVTPSES